MRLSKGPWRDVPTRTMAAAGTQFAVREYGAHSEVPLVLLTHLGANLDSWDPAVVDALALDRRLIAIDYRGVGASAGVVADTFDAMAADVIAVLGALEYERIDLFGLSMGGMVAQALLGQAPELVERVVLAGTGPQHGPGLKAMTGVAIRSTVRAALTRRDPKQLLFFTRSAAGRAAASAYLRRLTERNRNRDSSVTPAVFRAQLRAVNRWGDAAAPSAPLWSSPTLLIHGEEDRMVPVVNAHALHALLPDSSLATFPDSGHGVVFQHSTAVTDTIRQFLTR
ncbi:pimeloyl-ACP methyl ester carboxylesterase [Curtobacterium sp. PhB172]|nr:pimeloyl-ACP methyl ester carboxylesterase [Curtobacterium sp. PhB78]ROS65086.1 pimeloyl-ACP methyl ester carboxylesterase [Curtobacterium sp. PhB172]RPE85391.1 pimeloyl-ACP methyl ester carboxylesterase [Curtobacterium sp. PhB137]